MYAVLTEELPDICSNTQSTMYDTVSPCLHTHQLYF